MSTIAVLGSGRVATTLANGLAAAGHKVTIGSRDPETTAANRADHDVAVAGIAEAVAEADVVINATPGETAVERLGALQAELAGRILVDVANATTRTADGVPGGLVYPGSSLGQRLQEALPRTRVVKTLNTMLFSVMADPGSLQTAPTAFLSGDDDDAKSVVRGLLHDLGWDDEHILDLGGIRSAEGVEAVMLLVPDLVKARGFRPFAITVAG
jgi:predicted dinucleotide-binding enzyme